MSRTYERFCELLSAYNETDEKWMPIQKAHELLGSVNEDEIWEQRHAAADALFTYIAELEAEVLELKPYRDGYDANEIYPEEKEKVFAKTKHGIFVAQHKFDNWYNMFGEIVTDEIECWWKIPGTWK